LPPLDFGDSAAPHPTLVSITAEIFLGTLLAVQKSKCLLRMLMREECRCNKYISTGLGLLTFYQARHAIETQRTNNITFREIGVKNIREFGRSHCMTARKVERVFPTGNKYCF